jgi:hypothetical protein
MLKEHLREIWKVVELSKERDAVPSLIKKNGEEARGSFSLSEIEGKNPAYDKLDNNLYNYLVSLDYDTLVAVQVIMLLGRGDCSCAKENSKLIGEELFEEVKKELDDTISRDKQNIIEYVAGKGRLGEWLENGLLILNM